MSGRVRVERNQARRLALPASLGALCLLGVPSSAVAQPTLLVADEDKVQPFKFDENRDQISASFSLGVEGAASDSTPPAPSYRIAGDLISEQDRRLNKSNVKVTIEPYSVGAFPVRVEITPPESAKPGRYTGVVNFGGSGYTQVVPVTVVATLKSTSLYAASLAAFGWLIGLMVKAATDLFKADNRQIRRGVDVKSYFIRGGFIPTAVLGAVGAFAAWAFTYLPNDIWGSDSLDDPRLFGAALAGVVTGTTISDFFSPYKG